jgi:hypothetical protein
VEFEANRGAYSFEFTTEQVVHADTIQVGPAAAWTAIAQAFSDLGLPRGEAREGTTTYGVPRTTVRRSLAGVPLSRFLRCGSTMGAPNADSYDVTLSLITRLQPLSSAATIVQSQLSAHARQTGVSANPLPCTTTRELERRVGRLIEYHASMQRRTGMIPAPTSYSFTTSTSRTSTPSGWLGKTPDRGVFIAAVRSSWRIAGREDGASVSYFTELVPVSFVTQNATEIEPIESCIQRHPEWRHQQTVPAIEYFEKCARDRPNAYGAGFTPLGLSARFARRGGIALLTEAWFGGILFDRSVPYPNTTRFNYNVSAGTALEFPLGGRSVLSVGYHMHHLSNGGRGAFNPGILAHALHLGIGRRR